MCPRLVCSKTLFLRHWNSVQISQPSLVHGCDCGLSGLFFPGLGGISSQHSSLKVNGSSHCHFLLLSSFLPFLRIVGTISQQPSMPLMCKTSPPPSRARCWSASHRRDARR